MTASNLVDVDDLNGTVVAEIRECVMSRIEEEPEKFHPSDVKRFKERSEMIYRFLIEYIEDNGGINSQNDHSCVEKVTRSIVDTLKWRVEFNVNNMKDSDFPEEFYKSKLFLLGTRSDGSLFIIINVRKLVRLRQWSNVYLRFIIHEMDKIGEEVMFSDPDFLKKPKPHVLADASEIGLAQMDFTFIFSIIPIFLNHYPQGFTTIWLYELPMFSRHMKGIVLKTLPHRITKKIMFTDKKHIIDDMGAENLPVDYNGCSNQQLRELSSATASNLREVGKKNDISEKEIEKMMAQMSY
jgi:hypothetical protein